MAHSTLSVMSAVASGSRRCHPARAPARGCGINVIPTLEEQAKAKWSDVQNQYQRRADLIPNLVETVKGFAAQERQVLEAVVKARAQATGVQLPPDLLTNPEAFKRFQEAQASSAARSAASLRCRSVIPS